VIKAVIFDFDGLILDTESSWYQACCDMYREHGHDLSLELYGRFVGTSDNPLSYLTELIAQPDRFEELRRRAKEKHHASLRRQQPRPGVLDYLKTARRIGLRIGLASSSSREWVETHLKRYQLFDFFESIKTRDDVERTKPDPELYVRSLQALGVAPQEAVAFEDSPSGARAARAAGLHCVVVPNAVTRELVFGPYDLRLESMAERDLPEVIAHLNTSLYKAQPSGG
jgi:putative hydrolase of the HAD superfamily